MPTLTQIEIVFARYANLTLGGGSATAATMHRELVEKRHWLTEEQFTLSFALGRITSGTNLLAFCTGFGWALRGLSGAIVALLASSIP
jgi:chromate transporter